ncbi:ABC transporter ATP-binding protein [Variovorax ginsengisoli]|uniref:ABC transporter ATP-binding protein n=1 Tax=Variovorax ginsengisoli TaxID=363844 RepID=A0ABT8S9K7_9BURK|nr:ABC transporter ATP-binding protein [Variovorax ginsengisoli]MDN8616430.1 ABC transporter ATP-binding protein [Variovorax ginsengisoli]MDO1535600.1 ABC transporter ATP-binding protein [Variovorax ginsengisoli]
MGNAPQTANEDFILRASKLTKTFRGFTAVNEVDINVRRGHIHAVIGPNGAGKTTCFNLLTKFLQPTGGTIHFDGIDITRRAPADIARLGLVRSFQISAVFPQLTALKNVRVALQRRTRGDSFDFWRAERCLSALEDEAMSLLEAFGLSAFSGVPAAELAYGRKRALELATTIAVNPRMLLLDEPMAGLGREDIERVAEIIRRIARGRTVLMVEHNLSVVSRLSDHITVLARGEVLAHGDYATVSNDERVIEAYLGSAAHV